MSLQLEPAIQIGEPARLKPLLATAWRYALSTSGPVATSGAHFLASLMFVRALPAAGFGIFSFVMVIVPFAMSMIGALLVIPVTHALAQSDEQRAAVTANCLKMNLALSAATVLAVTGLLIAARAEPIAAILLGLFGGVLVFRWFARCFAYVEGRVHTAVASDIVYAVALVMGLGLLALIHHVTLIGGALVMLGAALAGLMPLGRKFFAAQFAALFTGHVRGYGAIFRDVTRWSLLGVIFTEFAVNAHAYLVTFISGSGSFALLALGMLLMRPASLVQSALPDLERPVMTRQIAASDWDGLARTRMRFGTGLLVMLLLTLVADAGLLHWFPQLLLQDKYPMQDVIMVASITAAIMAVRCLRAPPAVLLQAAGAFKDLAAISIKCCGISVVATLSLLLAFGPIASLGGVLLGEIAILFYCQRRLAAWQVANG